MPTSERQRIANVENARKSTGPRTPVGKQIASRNSIKHGAFGKNLLWQGEDPTEYSELVSELHESLRPVGRLEIELVEKIAAAMWRQRRLIHWEQVEAYWKALEVRGQPDKGTSLLDFQTQENLAKYHTIFDSQIFKTLRALRQTQRWRLETIETVSIDD